MIAYHGTIKKKGDSIIKDSVIDTKTEENSHWTECSESSRTTERFIYLALDVEKAFDYGLRAWQKVYGGDTIEDSGVYIFEATLDGIKRYPDNDEIFCEDKSFEENIAETGTLSIKDRLEINENVKQYLKIEFSTYEEGKSILEEMEEQVNEKDFSINSLEWIKFI